MFNKIQTLDLLFKNNIIEIKDIVLKANIISPYYCDFRKLMNYPDLFNTIIDQLIKLIDTNQLQYDIVSGVPMGALPFSSVLANKLHCRQIIIRDKQKTYGNNNLIEGIIKQFDTVLVIEDVITTGASCLNIIEKAPKKRKK